MHALDILGDPVRRRILALLSDGEHAAGEVGAVVQREFGISQPAVSSHLKVLRDNGFTRVRADGVRRLYAVNPDRLQEVDRWLAPFRAFWAPRLDALGTEIARGRRARRSGRTEQAPGREAQHPARNPRHTDHDGSHP
jgi:DNA-binding transcriptional ArsR family regulator